MGRVLWLLLALMMLHHTQARSDVFELPAEINNFEPFTLRAGCPYYQVHRFFGTEVEGDEINIYASVAPAQEGFLVPCFEGTLEIGPIASGSYTVNYYISDSGDPFELYESHDILIEKISENEPASGRVIISGETAEDQTLTASHTLSDHNGMGEIRYQWLRNGEAVPGATTEHYRLTDEDIGFNVQCILSFEDGLGITENVSSLPAGAPGSITNINDPPVGLVYIRGSVSEGSTLTIDTSALSDPDGIGELRFYWKRNYRLYSTLGEDIGTNLSTYTPTVDDHYYYLSAVVTYTDQHGTRERLESNLTGQVSPATRLIVTPPDDITQAASGALTRIDPGRATAREGNEGGLDTVLTHLVSNGVETVPPTDSLLDLPPGTHLLTWTADDRYGISGEGIQIVRIDPIVTFGAAPSTPPEGSIDCPLILNGMPARYPVSIPYTLTALSSTDGSEVVLRSGTHRIDQPQLESVLSISNTLLGDLSGYTSAQLTMEAPTNATLGNEPTCHVVLSNENFPPHVTLSAQQGEVPTRILNQSAGQVIVSARVQDPNSSDSHTYDWSETDSRLNDLDSTQERFIFDPAELDPDLYRVSLRVSDGTATDTAVLTLRVVAEATELTSVDSDGDGETDLDEGSGDSDADGIPDYLDPVDLPLNVLLQEPRSDNRYLMQTESELILTLGDIALFAQHHGALISRGDMLDYSGNDQGIEADAEQFPYEGGLFDFGLGGITPAGSSVKVVIPQRQAVAATSIYRKWTPSGWGEFVVDENNQIKSSAGEAGLCPAPGDSAYIVGLSEGAWCVELTIEDGGANDADGEVNGSISDPGGITTLLSIENETGSGSGGGGSFNPWMMTLLAFAALLLTTESGSGPVKNRKVHRFHFTA